MKTLPFIECLLYDKTCLKYVTHIILFNPYNNFTKYTLPSPSYPRNWRKDRLCNLSKFTELVSIKAKLLTQVVITPKPWILTTHYTIPGLLRHMPQFPQNKLYNIDGGDMAYQPIFQIFFWRISTISEWCDCQKASSILVCSNRNFVSKMRETWSCCTAHSLSPHLLWLSHLKEHTNKDNR